MKICIIYPQFNILGGAQNQILNLTKSLNKHGHKITIVTLAMSKYYYKIFNRFTDIRIINVPLKKIFMKRPFLYFFIIAYNLFNKNRFLNNFDLINPHGYPTHWLCNGFKKKTVWMCNEPPMYYLIIKEKNRLLLFFKSIFKKVFYKFFEIPITKKSVGHIVALDESRKKIIKSIYGLDIDVARSGIDTSIFKKLKKKKYDKIKILFVSRLFEHKRLIDFLEAAEIISKKYKNLEFYVIGDGPLEPTVQEFKNKMKNLFHFKNIPIKDLVKIYNDSHIFVFPAVNQPWGLVVLEAIACGCVAIVSTDTGVSEVLTNNENAILIEPYKPDKIIKHIEYLLNNPEYMKKLAKNGHNFVKKNLTMRTYVDKMEKIFMKVLNN